MIVSLSQDLKRPVTIADLNPILAHTQMPDQIPNTFQSLPEHLNAFAIPFMNEVLLDAFGILK